MAWTRVYGRCNMDALLQNQAIPPESIKSFLAQTSSTITNGLHEFRSTSNSDENRGRAMEQFSEDSNGDHIEIDRDEFSYHPEKKRRLTDNQVEYLEKSFETETRLEPERKIQLAKELGLQPRQVAVWFQNRRARWRTKQLEKDFETLRSNYSNLKNDYDNLLKEKEKLTTEVLRLSDKLLRKRSNKQAPLMETSEASTEKQKQSQNSIFEAKKIGNEQSSGSLSVYDYNDAEIAAMVESDYSSNAFEADRSDLSHEHSHLDGEEEIKGYRYVQGSLFDCVFPGDEEQDLWLWH